MKNSVLTYILGNAYDEIKLANIRRNFVGGKFLMLSFGTPLTVKNKNGKRYVPKLTTTFNVVIHNFRLNTMRSIITGRKLSEICQH
jgi:hypothetical protein